jgi:hypothetical protein
MTKPLAWEKLSREQQTVLERLWAGGTIRGKDPVTVLGLARMGYVVGDRLTKAGDKLCADALTGMMERMRADEDRERRIALAS